MPEKKRKFEADVHPVHNLKLQPRPIVEDGSDLETGLPEDSLLLPALPFSQDVVLRLIKTLKKI